MRDMGMWDLTEGQGKHHVRLQIWDTGEGCCGLLSGGELPHVGGVVLAVPRNSLSGQGVSCDLWLSPVAGHKDTEAAAPLAREICRELNVCVTISAGIHIDNATPEDLLCLERNCRAVCREFLERYKKDKGRIF